MSILKKLKYRYYQFRNEVEGQISELQILIVSLYYLNKFELFEVSEVFLILDCYRDALIMRIFCFFRILPRYQLAVTEQARDLHFLISKNFSKSTRIVITSRQYIKNYQLLASLRREKKLIIL